MTESQFRNSRTRAAESLASIATPTARSSFCAFAAAFAFSALRPATPTRSTPGLDSRSGTVDWAIAPYPPRMMIFTKRPRLAGSRGTHLPFSSDPSPSPIERVARTADPDRMRPTLRPNAGPYPSHSAVKPPTSGPRIDPNPWTALYAPNAWARPLTGAKWDTSVEPATLMTAQHKPTPEWRTKMIASKPITGIGTNP